MHQIVDAPEGFVVLSGQSFWQGVLEALSSSIAVSLSRFVEVKLDMRGRVGERLMPSCLKRDTLERVSQVQILPLPPQHTDFNLVVVTTCSTHERVQIVC
jgi:hypothetical protein